MCAADVATEGRGGALPAETRATTSANLAGAWSAQPVPASPRPPRAAHRPAAARAPRTTPAGVHAPAATARSAPAPTNSPSAARVRGRRAMAEEVGVRQPDGGQAAADDARPRPPERGPRCPSQPASFSQQASKQASKQASGGASCMKTPSASCSLRAPIRRHSEGVFQPPSTHPGCNLRILLRASLLADDGPARAQRA